MQTLFGRLKPITSRLAFIKADINQVVEKFLEWQSPLIAQYNNSFVRTSQNSTLEKTLLELCPLTTTDHRKYLFIPTNSQWIAFFDNGHTGTDRTAPEVLSRILKTECAYIVCDVDSGETLLDIYGKVGNNEMGLTRSIAVINESGWKFYQYGNPLPFENLQAYAARLIKNRFNLSLLLDYLKKIEIDLFNETYFSSNRAVLLSKTGPKFKSTEELTLEQAQRFFTP